MSKIIRFAHLADLHIGSWRDKKLTELNFQTFKKAIDKVISEKVDFCLFAGDIFNNAMPSIELVQKALVEFMKLKENNIPLYVIGGSHDYSNSGKSFIQLLDKANVFTDVCKYKQIDKNKVQLELTKDKSGAIISGILGRKNGLDKNIYINLNSNTLSKDNLNIFMFHTTLNDFKPDFMKAVKTEITKSYLPSGFDYYAGGHIHTHMVGNYNSGILSYPGPLFPNNFSELKIETPSFNLCEFNFENRETKIKRILLKTYEKEFLKLELNNANPIDAYSQIIEKIADLNLDNKIFLLELSGVIEGKISDMNINKIVSKCYEKGALSVLKNTYKLTSSNIKIENINLDENSEDIENDIIKEVLDDEFNQDNLKLIKSLLSLELNKFEGEKVSQYEQRVSEALEKVLNS